MTYIKKGRVVRIPWPKATNQDAWLELRAKLSGADTDDEIRLGASEISVATGSNTFQCAARLFHKLTGWHSKMEINETLIAGHLMEPVIASRYESLEFDEYGNVDMEKSCHNAVNEVKVRKVRKAKFFLQNTAYPYLNVSLDYVPSGPSYSPWSGEKYKPLTPIELKTTNENYYKLWPKIDQGYGPVSIALPYMEQIQIQMLVSNTQVAVFLVMIDGRNFKAFEIHRDDAMLEEMLPKIEAYVENAKKGRRLVRMMQELLADGETEESEMYQTYLKMYESITPAPTGMKDDLKLAEEITDTDDKISDQMKDATPKDDALLEAYMAQNDIAAEVEKEKRRIRTELVYSAGKWNGIFSKNTGLRMVNRLANKETGSRAYFSIK